MKKVYKYKFKIADEFTIDMPLGARILRWDFQNDIPCIWALVEADSRKMSTYHFRLAGTGHPIEQKCPLYINTVFLNEGSLVLHLFLVDIDL